MRRNPAFSRPTACLMMAALGAHRSQFPFVIRGIASDNGSEFLNPHLLALCENQHITLTRSRIITRTTAVTWSRKLDGGAPVCRLPAL